MSVSCKPLQIVRTCLNPYSKHFNALAKGQNLKIAKLGHEFTQLWSHKSVIVTKTTWKSFRVICVTTAIV